MSVLYALIIYIYTSLSSTSAVFVHTYTPLVPNPSQPQDLIQVPQLPLQTLRSQAPKHPNTLTTSR